TSAVYSGIDLAPGMTLENCAEGSASIGCYTINATAHGATALGDKTTVEVDDASGLIVFKEILRTDCSCTENPSVNLVVGNPVCLETSSPDNNANLICIGDNTPNPPGACCNGYDLGTCTASSVCTARNAPLFCCSGAGSYSACKGAESPLWTLTGLKD